MIKTSEITSLKIKIKKIIKFCIKILDFIMRGGLILMKKKNLYNKSSKTHCYHFITSYRNDSSYKELTLIQH